MQKTVIGFVEDDPVIRQNYCELLETEGYEVLCYDNRTDALDAFSGYCPDLLLIDVALGNERDGGFQLCKQIRTLYPVVPIVFLTSYDSDIDKISGLRLGADDYLSKDVSTMYLTVRIETLLRRTTAIRDDLGETATEQVNLGKLIIDDHQSSINWNGEELNLPLTQYWMVKELASSGQVRSPEQLMRAAKIVVEPNTIVAHIKSIRRKFTEIDKGFSGIRTERGLGYRWIVQ